MANVPLPASDIPRRVLTGTFSIGRVHTPLANMAANDTMEIGVIPAGGRLIGAHIKCDTAVAGTVDIGTVATVDLYMDGSAALATAELVGSADEALGDVVSVDTLVRATFLTAAPDAGEVVTAWLQVTFDSFEGDSEALV